MVSTSQQAGRFKGAHLMRSANRHPYTWFEGVQGEIRIVLGACGTKFYVFKLEPAPKATDYEWIQIDTIPLEIEQPRSKNKKRYSIIEVPE